MRELTISDLSRGRGWRIRVGGLIKVWEDGMIRRRTVIWSLTDEEDASECPGTEGLDDLPIFQTSRGERVVGEMKA